MEPAYAEVPVKEAPPRPGDAVGAYAKVDKARARELARAKLTMLGLNGSRYPAPFGSSHASVAGLNRP